MSSKARAVPGPLSGLSAKLIATLILVILAVEVVIYLPSAANFRLTWLEDRLRIGIVATRVLDAVPDVLAVPQPLTDRLLTSAGLTAIVYRREGQSQLIALGGDGMPREAQTVDLRLRDPMSLIAGALDTLVSGPDRTLRIISSTEGDADTLVEVLMPEAGLYRELWVYSRNIFFLSLLVAALTALVIYIFLNLVIIGPVRRLTANIVAFREAPENARLIAPPTGRKDELGVVQRELAAMETDLFTMLRQRRHLADLGLAVAKINHDLRNTLTSAQLLSDQVATLDDPKVQRLAPRLVHTLDRAIGFAQSVLDYGRQSAMPPRPSAVDLRLLLSEAAVDAGLVGQAIAFANQVPDDVVITVDPEQFARILTNLIKNAREALEASGDKITEPQVTASVTQDETSLVITIADNGPGLAPRARDNLFVAFEGSAKAGGTGLGLAIARELAQAHGGDLLFVSTDTGTRFDIVLPISSRT